MGITRAIAENDLVVRSGALDRRYRDRPLPGRRDCGHRGAIVACVIELEINRGAAPDEYQVQVIQSPAGEATADVRLPSRPVLAARSHMQQALLASAVASRRLVSDVERPVRELGHELFMALFSPAAVSSRFRASSAIADERGEPLRVVLRVNVPELAALPWEAMYDAEAGSYICRREPLVRFVPVASAAAPLKVELPLRVLAVAASPRGLPLLDVEKERENLTRSLADAIRVGAVELQWAESATWGNLQDLLLSGEWHIVHFIGHGDFDVDQDEGVLALVAADGRVNRVEANRFVDLLREARPMPRLVVLNSCSSATSGAGDLFSGTAAALVRGGVGAVTAMQFEISDAAAIEFCRGFYTAIARGRGVDEAVRSGRVAILGTGGATLEWITPVLYLRSLDAHLFTVDPGRLPQPKASGDVLDATLRRNDDLLKRRVVEARARGRDAERARDWPAAAEAYQSVIELDPGDDDAAARRDACRYRASATPGGAPDYSVPVSSKPDSGASTAPGPPVGSEADVPHNSEAVAKDCLERLWQVAKAVPWKQRPLKWDMQSMATVVSPSEVVKGVCRLPFNTFQSCAFAVTNEYLYLSIDKSIKNWIQIYYQASENCRMGECLLRFSLAEVSLCKIQAGVFTLDFRDGSKINFKTNSSDYGPLVEGFMEKARQSD